MTQLHIIDTCITSICRGYFWLMTGKIRFFIISNYARETVVMGGHLSLRTIILTEKKREVGRGHLSLGTMILTVEPGKGGKGSFVSRNNNSNCRTRGERGRGSFVSMNNDSNWRIREKEEGGVICQ